MQHWGLTPIWHRLVAVAMVAAIAGGCANGGGPPGHPVAAGHPCTGAPPPARYRHVITIVMENEDYGSIIGDADAPYVNRLAARYGLATNSFGVRHSSLPDYLALTSGSTHGIDSGCTDCHVNARNVVDQLEAAHFTWKAYMEDMPKPCFQGAGFDGYAKKHNPFA